MAILTALRISLHAAPLAVTLSVAGQQSCALPFGIPRLIQSPCPTFPGGGADGPPGLAGLSQPSRCVSSALLYGVRFAVTSALRAQRFAEASRPFGQSRRPDLPRARDWPNHVPPHPLLPYLSAACSVLSMDARPDLRSDGPWRADLPTSLVTSPSPTPVPASAKLPRSG